MEIFFTFVRSVSLLCLLLVGAVFGVAPPNKESKIFIIDETFDKDDIIYDVLHHETNKYYETYTRGPCGKLMWIERENPKSVNGICRCIQTPLGLRATIYWEPTNRCYLEYDQGPCEEGEWLIYNKLEKQQKCQQNPCPTSKLEKDLDIDMESLIDLETDYYLVENNDDTNCFRNKLDIKTLHLQNWKPGSSRFVFNNEAQKFFPKGEKALCPTLMEITQLDWPSEAYGECSCRSLEFSQRPIIFWQPTNRCYFAFAQGPCAADEWLVGNKDKVACKKHQCKSTPPVNNEEDDAMPVLEPDIQFFVQDSNGTCYETNTQAFCPIDKKLFLGSDGATPLCYTVNQNGKRVNVYEDEKSATFSGQQSCGEGFVSEESGKCVRSVIFD